MTNNLGELNPEQLAQLFDVDGKNGFDAADVRAAAAKGQITAAEADRLVAMAGQDGIFQQAELSSIKINPAMQELLNRPELAAQIFSPEERAGLLATCVVASMQTQISGAQHAAHASAQSVTDARVNGQANGIVYG